MDYAGYRARRRADEADLLAFESHYGGIDETAPVAPEQAAGEAVPNHDGATGFDIPNYRPPPSIPDSHLPGAISSGEGLQGTFTTAGPHKDDPKAAYVRMSPHLQMMCGPMLRYDTVVDWVWHGFALAVTADEGSDYGRKPVIRFTTRPAANTDPLNQTASLSLSDSSQETVCEGYAIYNYHSLHGGNTFWRFKLEIPMQPYEVEVTYSLNGARALNFYVPAQSQNMRWAGHSCNGFSAGVNTEEFNGPSPLWEDLLEQHKQKPIHVLVGGGDQIYCDPLSREPELATWIASKDETWKAKHPLTNEMKFTLDRFFFNHYASWFRNGAFGRAIAHIPMLNMLDDHDLIDGFGSYPDSLQTSPVFSAIGGRGYFWYLLFQMFMIDDIDGTSPNGPHPSKSLIIGGEGSYIPFPSHNFLSYMGPNQAILLLDCRAERKLNLICSPITYDRVFAAINKLPPSVTQLTILLGVPIAYPRMIFAEKFMDSKLNPLVMLGKTGSLGLSGFVNKFNGQAELLDDLSDHWTATDHKEERNWLIQECEKLSRANKLRITFLSGDVHAGACGRFFSKDKVAPEHDPKYMLNVISSAIVNTPPPPTMIKVLNKLAGKTHKTLHHAGIDEDMVSLFTEDTDGSKLSNQYIIGKRNYCIQDYLPSGELQFDVRVEIKQGGGKTKSYAVKAPRVDF